MVRVLKPCQTVAVQGKAEIHILNLKNTWAEFQKHSQTATERREAELRILNFETTWSEFHYLPRIGPKQLCALAHLGCTCSAGTSYFSTKEIISAQMS